MNNGGRGNVMPKKRARGVVDGTFCEIYQYDALV